MRTLIIKVSEIYDEVNHDMKLKADSNRKGMIEVDLIENAGLINLIDFIQILSQEYKLEQIFMGFNMQYRSIKWIFYRTIKPLICERALEAIRFNKALVHKFQVPGEEIMPMKLPILSFVIEQIMIIKFNKQILLFVEFENQSTQVFDFETGNFLKEFHFQDN